MYVGLKITWHYRLEMSQKEHFFFVFDVSNGDTRFLLLLLWIARMSNVISENTDFLKFLDWITL
jgi:hypothetical protein